MYCNIIGIDVSKDDFVVARHGCNDVKTFSNTTKGFEDFTKNYQKYLPNCLVVLEVTGGYEQALTLHIVDQGITLHKASGLQVKNFIRSFGRIAKTDKIDAIAIARYGHDRQQDLKLFQKKSDDNAKLYYLVMRKEDLMQILVAEKNRAKAPNNDFTVKDILRHIAFIDNEIKDIESQINEIINSDPICKEKAEILKTIPGIGEKTVQNLLAKLPELGTLNGKQIASLCGVAPHPKQSGKSNGYRSTKGGRRDLRPNLFLAAMAAGRSKSKLGDWHASLIARGKKKMVAKVALMRKIVVIANAKIRDYLRSKASEEICSANA